MIYHDLPFQTEICHSYMFVFQRDTSHVFISFARESEAHSRPHLSSNELPRIPWFLILVHLTQIYINMIVFPSIFCQIFQRKLLAYV